MRYSLFLLCFILNGCWYSNGCFYTPQMVNCVDKGKSWPAIAHYQKPYSIGKTNSHQRWKDAVKCGAEYGDYDLKKLHSDNYEKFHSCMETKGYKKFWPAECGYKNSKWDKGICNE
ncbi:Uncharacterised protein [Stutzerimonas stutzeri]|nr:Uncharacterised protein [Stutzerimonas stutzeri]